MNKIGARTLCVAGIATNQVVKGTARHAADMAYRVVVVRDARSAATALAHDASLEAMSHMCVNATSRAAAESCEGR